MAVKKSKIDEALHDLYKITPPDTPLSYAEIAAHCGCNHELIRNFERRALRKLRLRLIQSLHANDRQAFLASDAGTLRSW